MLKSGKNVLGDSNIILIENQTPLVIPGRNKMTSLNQFLAYI